jgi:DNA-binding NtrC family response regulator
VNDKKDVLVVEDNDFVRMQISKFLQTGGYTAIEATNAPDGLELLQANKNTIGCLLVDVRMEPMDGFGFLNQVQVADIKIPSILVTGDDNPDILSKGSALGVLSVLMKPVNKDRLLKMVDRAIQIAGRVS